jgi:hypothetical protein
MFVTPDKANSKKRKILILVLTGTALIRVNQWQKVKWWVPAYQKTLLILAVIN